MNCSGRNCREFMEQLPEAVFLETLDGDILDVNQEACELLGYSRQELLEMEVDDLVPEEAPTFLPDRIDEATRSGEPLETINVDKEGNRIPVELKGKLIEVEGNERMLISVRDISERKETEEELQFESSLLESLLKHIPDLIYFKDKEARFIRVSRSKAEEVGEDSREDLHGKTDLDYYPEEQAKKDFQDDMQVIDEEEPVLQKEERYLQEGRTYWLEATKVPRYDEDGNLVGLLGISRDITERKRAEQELEETKERLRQDKELYQSYFEELGDAVYITKVGGEDHGRILDANSAAVDQTGYSTEELIGMNIEDDIAIEPPEMGYEQADERLLRGEPISFVEKKKRKDGTEFWTAVVVTRIEHEGTSASLSINRDITERKKVKEQLKQYKMAVEGSDDLMAACDKNYNYIFANQAYRSYYKVEDDDIKNYKVEDLVGSETFENSVKPRVDRCLAGERVEYEMTRSHPSKGDRALNITYYPLEGENQIHGVVAVMRDVTERKDTEDALQEERDKLKNLHDAVDRLQQQETQGEVLRTAVEVAESILDFDICAIDLREGDYLVTKAISTGLDSDQTDRFKIGEGIAGKTFQKGETIWGNDLRNHPEAKPTSSEFKGFISAPLDNLGVIQIVSKREGSFVRQDVELAEVLAGHLREELLRVRLEEDLREQAIHDPLTGLYNRRYFNESLGKEVERCKRYDESLAFLMMDVNRFKEINDRYTHHTGDEVLQAIANLLKDNVRDADTVVRYGGDEFLIMMPETRKVEGTINRLEEKLKKWNEKSDLVDFPVTLAKGTSRWSPDQDKDAEEALKEADRKMYEEKDR